MLTSALSTVPEKMVDHRTCAVSRSYVIWSTSSHYQSRSLRALQRPSRLRGRHGGLASAPPQGARADGGPPRTRALCDVCHVAHRLSASVSLRGLPGGRASPRAGLVGQAPGAHIPGYWRETTALVTTLAIWSPSEYLTPSPGLAGHSGDGSDIGHGFAVIVTFAGCW